MSIKSDLIKKALKKSGSNQILPCGKTTTIDECITVDKYGDKQIYILWFNTVNSKTTNCVTTII